MSLKSNAGAGFEFLEGGIKAKKCGTNGILIVPGGQ